MRLVRIPTVGPDDPEIYVNPDHVMVVHADTQGRFQSHIHISDDTSIHARVSAHCVMELLTVVPA